VTSLSASASASASASGPGSQASPLNVIERGQDRVCHIGNRSSGPQFMPATLTVIVETHRATIRF
jgi:hypothetical protein